MNGSPSVTVILPFRHLGPRFGEAVETLLAQTFCDFEVIVGGGDGPFTASEPMERPAASLSIRARTVSIDDADLATVCTAALGDAKGRYVCTIVGGDLPLPGCFERLVAFLEFMPAVMYASGWFGLDRSGGRMDANAL